MGTRTLTVRLQADIASLRAGLGAGAAEVKAFGSEVGSAAASTTQNTDKLARGFLIAGGVIAAALAGSVIAAAQFEASLRNVATISTYVGQNFDAVGQKLQAMSARLPQSANELARGLYDVASSGFAGKEGLTVLEQSARAASAGLSDTATAGRAITGVLNAYGLQAKDSKNVSDILFQTVNLGVVTFEELSQNIGDVIGVASAAGVGIRDVGTAIATITLAGVPAAEATTSLNRVIQSLLQPSDALTEKFHSWGFESGEAALHSLGLQGVMLRLRKEVGSSATAFLQLFPEIRAARGALALTAADGENYIRVSKGMDDATRGQGATQRALNEQAKSLAFQFQLLKNQVTNLAIGIGGELLPALKVLGSIASGIVKNFSSMPGPMRSVVVALAAVSAALLLAGGSFLLISSRIAAMRAQLIAAGPAGARFAGALGGLTRAASLAGGIAALTYGLTAFDGSLEGTVTGVLSLVTAVALLRPGLTGMQSALSGLSTRLTAGSFSEAGVAVGGLATGVGRLSSALPGIVATGAIAAASIGEIGKSAEGTLIGMTSMIATGAQVGFVIGGPMGAAVGAGVGLLGSLAAAFDNSGVSAEEFDKRINATIKTLQGLGPAAASFKFGELVDAGPTTGNLEDLIKKESKALREIAAQSPTTARTILQGERMKQGAYRDTSAELAALQRAYEKGTATYVRTQDQQEKTAAGDRAVRDAHGELTAATAQLSEGEQKVADAFAKSVDAIATAATASLPTAKGAFEQIQSAAAQFGVEMDPAVLLAGFKEKLAAELDFGTNVTTIMQGGFLEIGNVIAQEGPEKGAAVAKALADGIKSGDTTIAGQLDQTAKLMTAVPGALESQFSSTWGPALVRGQAGALSQLTPGILAFFGVKLPGDIAAQAPAQTTAAEQLAAAASFGYVNGIQGIPATAEQTAAAASFGFVNGAPVAATSGQTLGSVLAVGFDAGLKPVPGAAGAAVAGAQGAVTAGAPALAATGAAAGTSTTEGLGTGLAGMPEKASLAVGQVAAALDTAAAGLGPAAIGIGYLIGQDFATGIASGISDNAGVIAAAAAGAVDAAEKAARKKADSQSPSRLFARVGQDLAAGMVVGIRAGLPEARAAAGALVGAGAVSSGVSGSRSSFGAASAAATGRVVNGSRSSSVQTTIQIGGNLYGDAATKKMLKDAADAHDRKLANNLRRRRE